MIGRITMKTPTAIPRLRWENNNKMVLHEADHSPPAGAEVKNAWSYTSIPQYVFM
jgi:hypothetical protein